MQTLGVPYEKGFEDEAVANLQAQAHGIAVELIEDIYMKLPKEVQASYDKEAEIAKMEKKQIVALIAYLQRLGTDIKGENN